MRPVVEPRTQNIKSPTSHSLTDALVNAVHSGFLSPNSVGPFNNGSPSPTVLYVWPLGDVPITTCATSRSFLKGTVIFRVPRNLSGSFSPARRLPDSSR